MKCQRCNSKRIATISGKTSDCNVINFKEEEHDGYVPNDIGLGDNSDYIEFSWCLECGQMQGNFPYADPKIDDDEDDED